jgi:hypothetical protein
MKISPILILICLFLFSGGCDGKENKLDTHRFTAKVSAVRLNSQLLDRGEDPNGSVSVEVPTIFFDPPINIKDARNKFHHKIPQINALVHYTAVNIDGSLEDVAPLLDPKERTEKVKFMSDPEIFKANQNYFKKYSGLNIIGIIYQKETASVLVNMRGSVMGVNIRKTDGEYFITDKPDDDLELAIIEASYNVNDFQPVSPK